MATASTTPPMLRLERSTQSGAKVMTAAYAAVFTDSSPMAWLFSGGDIDLSVMQALDVVSIRISAINTRGGSYAVQDTLTYTGVQPAGQVVKHISPIPNTYGLLIEMIQTVGAFRSVLCEFYTAKRVGQPY